jgi:hypothetical protein
MRYMNRTRVGVFVLAILTAVGAAGVWLFAQPKVATGTFGPIAANPPYIVVNTPTPVLFTAQITDPQLKKRSVVLVRLDDAGQPSDILGRLRDDGKNGDAVAGDKTYSMRTTLKEPVAGTASFKIAARFKPGKWQEPESDDDDWDVELKSAGGDRDLPAEKVKREKRLKKLSGYTLSGDVVVNGVSGYTDNAYGFSFGYSPGWSVSQPKPFSHGAVATIDPSSQVSTDSAEPVTFFTWANVDALPINEFFDGDPGPPLFRDAAEGVQVTAVNGVPATLFKSVTGFDTVDVLVIPSGRNYIQFSFTRGSQAMLAALATITVAP